MHVLSSPGLILQSRPHYATLQGLHRQYPNGPLIACVGQNPLGRMQAPSVPPALTPQTPQQKQQEARLQPGRPGGAAPHQDQTRQGFAAVTGMVQLGLCLIGACV